MKLRDNVHRNYKRTKLQIHRDEYKQLRNFTTTVIRQEEVAYFSHHINNSNNPKAMWNKLRKLGVGKANPSHCLPSNINDPKLINKFFVDA